MRFMVPFNRTRVLSKESFMLSAREEEERISSPMETVICRRELMSVDDTRWRMVGAGAESVCKHRSEARFERGGDGHLSASSPSRLCPPGAGHFGFRAPKARRRYIDLCTPTNHQPLALLIPSLVPSSSWHRLRLPVPF